MELNNVTISSLKHSLKLKLSDEIEHIETNCDNDLSKFIYFIRAEYMIDNVMNILDGLRSGIPF